MRNYPYWQILLVFFALYWTAGGLATFLILKTPQIGKRKKPKWPILVVFAVFCAIWITIDRYYAPATYPSGMGFFNLLKTWIVHKLTFRI